MKNNVIVLNIERSCLESILVLTFYFYFFWVAAGRQGRCRAEQEYPGAPSSRLFVCLNLYI
jgi:hypothetical protein